jgi:hypothetical protein
VVAANASWAASGFGGSEDEVYAFEHLLEAGDFALQMLDARGGDAIGTDAAVAGRGFPMRFDQVVFEHALERGVERALFDLKQSLERCLMCWTSAYPCMG